MKYLIALLFFLAGPLLTFTDFFVTLVEVLANDDVFALVVVAFGFAGAGVVAAAGFFAVSTF